MRRANRLVAPIAAKSLRLMRRHATPSNSRRREGSARVERYVRGAESVRFRYFARTAQSSPIPGAIGIVEPLSRSPSAYHNRTVFYPP